MGLVRRCLDFSVVHCLMAGATLRGVVRQRETGARRRWSRRPRLMRLGPAAARRQCSRYSAPIQAWRVWSAHRRAGRSGSHPRACACGRRSAVMRGGAVAWPSAAVAVERLPVTAASVSVPGLLAQAAQSMLAGRRCRPGLAPGAKQGCFRRLTGERPQLMTQKWRQPCASTRLEAGGWQLGPISARWPSTARRCSRPSAVHGELSTRGLRGLWRRP